RAEDVTLGERVSRTWLQDPKFDQLIDIVAVDPGSPGHILARVLPHREAMVAAVSTPLPPAVSASAAELTVQSAQSRSRPSRPARRGALSRSPHGPRPYSSRQTPEPGGTPPWVAPSPSPDPFELPPHGSSSR